MLTHQHYLSCPLSLSLSFSLLCFRLTILTGAGQGCASFEFSPRDAPVLLPFPTPLSLSLFFLSCLHQALVGNYKHRCARFPFRSVAPFAHSYFTARVAGRSGAGPRVPDPLSWIYSGVRPGRGRGTGVRSAAAVSQPSLPNLRTHLRTSLALLKVKNAPREKLEWHT